ncbi:hypothetical protein M3Y95_01239800 [Aphelenchoides besseyi]|nr:hypothetical protein M3Y95_01239800 [Aphelenchoides besseyi]
MSMFGLVQAGFTIENGKKPVYTTDGESTSEGATFQLKEDKLEFTVEKVGTEAGWASGMNMDIGGCTFKVEYTSSGGDKVGIGGGQVSMTSSVHATAESSGVSYGDPKESGTCTGSMSFTKVDSKSSVVVKFDYPKTEYPKLKFTFTNVLNATSNEDAVLADGWIALIVCCIVGALLIAVLIAVGVTWCCCWCERCCCNDLDRCSKWNKKKQQRKKALGLDKKGKDGKDNVPVTTPAAGQTNANAVDTTKLGQQQIPTKVGEQVVPPTGPSPAKLVPPPPGPSPVVLVPPPPGQKPVVQEAEQKQAPAKVAGVAVNNGNQGNNAAVDNAPANNVQAGAI